MREGEETKDQLEEEIRKKRETFTMNIRKNNREEIFHKRRNINQQDNPNSASTHKVDYHVVDPRYADYTRKLHQTRFYLTTLPELVKALKSDDVLEQHYGLIGIRKIMSMAENPPIQPIIDAGILQNLIYFVTQEQYPQLQLQATWALTNVASGEPHQCKSIVDKGVIPLFIKQLRSQYLGIVEQAVWALGNIASDSTLHRDAILMSGGIPNMVYAVKNPNNLQNKCLIQYAGWALSNMCRGQPLPNYEIIKDGIQQIAELIAEDHINDQSIVADCCWAITYSTSSENERVQMLLNVGLEKKLVCNLQTEVYSLLVATIRIIGHITMGDHKQTQKIIDQPNFYDHIYSLLYHDKKIVRAETCWIISNIAGGSIQQIDELICRDDILSTVLNLFESDGNDVKRQISHIFSNMGETGHPHRIFQLLKSLGVIRIYLINLTSDDFRLVRDCLQNMHALLKFGEKMKGPNQKNVFITEIMSYHGDSILQSLQQHEQKSIYELVGKIIRDFFQIDDSMEI